MFGKGDIKGSDISGTALKFRIKQTKVSGITNRDEISFRGRIWCPPIKEYDPSQTPP